MICDAAAFKAYVYRLCDIYSKLTVDPGYRPPRVVGPRSIRELLSQFPLSAKLKSLFSQSGDNNRAGDHRFPMNEGAADAPFIATRRLSGERTPAAKAQARARGATLNDFALTALYRSLFRTLAFKPGDQLTIPLMVDMSRYLGERDAYPPLTNLSSMVASRLDYRPNETFDGALGRVKAVMDGKKELNLGVNAFAKLDFLFRIFGDRTARGLLRKQMRQPLICMTNIGVLDELADHIRREIEASDFHGEGYRKICARLRVCGVRWIPRRVRRVMGENGLLAPHRVGRNQEKIHDGTIVTDKVNEMWGTDMSQTVTLEERRHVLFVAVEHANSEIVGIHAARSANRFEALEPVRQGVPVLRLHRARRSAWAQAASRSWLQLHVGEFQDEIKCLGIEASPSFVREPQGNSVAERFIRTWKGTAIGPDIQSHRGTCASNSSHSPSATMKLGSSRGMLRKPARVRESEPCREFRLARRSRPPYPGCLSSAAACLKTVPQSNPLAV